MTRESWQEGPGLTATLYRARLSADGTLPHAFTYRFLVEYEAGGNARTAATPSLRDAFLKWSPGRVALTMGQFKTPFSREYITSITQIETAERASVVDTLATKRDLGVLADAAAGTWGTLALGVFNGEGQNLPANRDSNVLIIGRATLRPLAAVTLAGDLAAFEDDSTRWGAEVHVEQGGGLLRAEAIGQHVRGRDRDDLGWYVLAGARVLPWLQLVGKLEDFQRPGIGVHRRLSATTAGVNVDLPGGRTRIVANWISRRTGFPRVTRDVGLAQVQVRF